MRKLNGFKWLFALAMLSSAVNADVIIDNQSIPGSEISSISITPNGGDLHVTTIPGYSITKEVVADSVTITSFFVTPTTIVEGGSATLSWATANAEACTASGGVGGWTGSVGISGTQVITAPTPGNYTFTLTCTGSEGDPAVSNVSLNVTSANAVAITDFSATPSTIDEGGTTTLSWTTQNATSCDASGGTDGWSGSSISVPNGSREITVTAAGDYTFTLRCYDASAGEAVASTVVAANSVGQCATPPLSGTEMTWTDFWQLNWPNPKFGTRAATVPRTGYLALEFNTGNVTTSGKIFTIETTTTIGVRLGAISECPGDFDVAPECDYVWGLGGGLSWATNGTSGCQLAANTTYYFNLTFTDGVTSSSATCSRSPCITSIQNYSR